MFSQDQYIFDIRQSAIVSHGTFFHRLTACKSTCEIAIVAATFQRRSFKHDFLSIILSAPKHLHYFSDNVSRFSPWRDQGSRKRRFATYRCRATSGFHGPRIPRWESLPVRILLARPSAQKFISGRKNASRFPSIYLIHFMRTVRKRGSGAA